MPDTFSLVAAHMFMDNYEVYAPIYKWMAFVSLDIAVHKVLIVNFDFMITLIGS